MRYTQSIGALCIVVLACLALRVPQAHENGGNAPRETGVRSGASGAMARAAIEGTMRRISFIEQLPEEQSAPRFSARLSNGTAAFFSDSVVFHLTQQGESPDIRNTAMAGMAGISSNLRGRSRGAARTHCGSFSVRYPGSNPGATVEGRGSRQETASIFVGADPAQ